MFTLIGAYAFIAYSRKLFTFPLKYLCKLKQPSERGEVKWQTRELSFIRFCFRNGNTFLGPVPVKRRQQICQIMNQSRDEYQSYNKCGILFKEERVELHKILK